jgi:hypothetical protein
MIDIKKVTHYVDMVTAPSGTVAAVFDLLVVDRDARINVAVYTRLAAIDPRLAIQLLGGTPSLTSSEVNTFARRIRAAAKADRNKIIRGIPAPDMWLVRARMLDIDEDRTRNSVVPFVLKELS